MKRNTLLIATALSLAPFAACAGSVSGEVDGDNVPALVSGAFADVSANGTHIGVSIQTSLPNTCELGTKFLDHLAKSKIESSDDVPDVLDGLESFIKADIPADFWVLTNVVVDDDGDDLEDEEFEFDDDGNDVSVTTVLCHMKDKPERDGDTLSFDTDCYRPEDGALTLNLVRDEHLGVRGNVDLEDTDGDNAGEVDIDVNAALCDSFDQGVDDLLDACDESSNTCSFAGEILNAAMFSESTFDHSAEAAEDGENGCEFAFDDECDEPDLCEPGTDTSDCG